MIQLSILDQSPVAEGKTPAEALAQTTRLAQEAERLGYRRFWVSEHHYTLSLAGSSPEVLIAHLAAKTATLRIGSGGVMLPHYSPYKVAENFRVLEALHPGRIDLGLGRAPGGMPLATRVLQEGRERGGDRYPQQVDDLIGYLHDTLDERHRFAGLRATPVVETAPEVWLLGSSGESAKLAAERGAGFAFAQFINGMEEVGVEAMQTYHRHFRPSELGAEPRTLVAIFAICAETEEAAKRVASSLELSLLLIEQGAAAKGVPSVETAQTYPYTAFDQYRLAANRKRMIVGSTEQVKQKIEALCAAYNTTECMVVTITHDFAARLHSYQLLAEAFGLMREQRQEARPKPSASGAQDS
ncbi:LLM class flavin-dependent oxidoreductase [Brevibacillus humidisoli]|uniref:LLM class flavin-dependent oxidoreductase n=1 Tax=Brevibacillus humidisoli TaxID=2895522 RepID=UPI001E58E1C3|nr:LLM class flavin-dependent oxidoreductase [Brevibacillus humidisoli]UFJ40983.1 LLM class flavin-dependent oxidoreductase [Brevibacillus humidisoli]